MSNPSLVRPPSRSMRAGLWLLLLPLAAGWTTARGLLAEGREAYEQGDYDTALRRWESAAQLRPEDPRAGFLRGNALYRLDRFEEAVESLSGAYQGARTPAQRNHVAYNMGNAFFRLGLYGQAVEAYERALEADPDDEDARHNLELARQRLQEQQQMGSPQSGGGEPQEGEAPSSPSAQDERAGGDARQPDPMEGLTPDEIERLLDYLEEQEQVMRRYFNPRPGQLEEEDAFGRDFFSMTRKELEEYMRRHQEDLLSPFNLEEEKLTKDW